MKKAILNTLIILFAVTINLSAQQQKIEFLQYSNLTYSNNELFVQYSIHQKTPDSTIRVVQKYKLPDSLTTSFLDMIGSSKVLSISSNKTVVIDGIAFSLKYTLANKPTSHIHGHPIGMNEQERLILNNFIASSTAYTNYAYKSFRDSLPDGEYYKNRGMVNYSLERKENGIWADVTDPLFILNGKRISLKHFKELEREAHKYTFEELKTPASTAVYGQQAQHGAVIITSK